MRRVTKEDIQFLLREHKLDAQKIMEQQWEELLVWIKELTVQSTQENFAIRPGPYVRLCSTPFRLEGQKIREHLRSCHLVCLAAATLGQETDERIARWEEQLDVMGKAAHIAANLHLENHCAWLQEQVCREMFQQNLFVTNRYWPGYGDFPLENQKGILTLLPKAKALGIYLDQQYGLHPQKTVISVMGISKKPHALSNHVCSVCDLRDTCIYSRFNARQENMNKA